MTIDSMLRNEKRSLARRFCATPALVIVIAASLAAIANTSSQAATKATALPSPKTLSQHLSHAAALATVSLSQIPSAATQTNLAERASSLDAAAIRYQNLASTAELSLYVNAPPRGVPQVFTTSKEIESAQATSVYQGVVTSILTKNAATDTALSNKLTDTLNTMEELWGSLSLSGIGAVASQVSLEERLVADERDTNTFTNSTTTPAPASGMLSVMGPSVLTPLQLANWFSSEYPAPSFPVPIIQMAALYIEQGNRLGVRGDVAFIQASLETGGFSVMSGTNNFAGLGDCNACHGGFNFPSVRAGVSAQVELLKAFADASYVTTHSPYSWLRTVGERGLCPTWFSLGGVWSSDTYYGEHILGLYLNALDLALSTTSSPAAKVASLARSTT